MADVLQTPDDRFNDLPDYDFAPHWLDVDGGSLGPLRMHFLDEGPRDGPVALLLHGEPTWSYLYRQFIPILTARGIRVIAPDMIGFGKSDKPTRTADYSYAGHVAWMQQFLDARGLTGMTLFGQDWGGLIGLRLVAANPDRFDRVMIGNTALPTGDHEPGEAFRAWRDYATTNPEFRIGGVVHRGTVSGLTEAERAAYDAPFPAEDYKAGARAFPALVPASPDDPARDDQIAAWEVLKTWDKPFLCCFSDSDPIMRGIDKLFLKLVPGTRDQPHFETPNAGHFLQEDAAELLATRMAEFMEAGR